MNKKEKIANIIHQINVIHSCMEEEEDSNGGGVLEPLDVFMKRSRVKIEELQQELREIKMNRKEQNRLQNTVSSIRIRKQRINNDLTQQKCADYLGCSYQGYQSLEKGRNSIYIGDVVRLAKLFKCEVMGLING